MRSLIQLHDKVFDCAKALLKPVMPILLRITFLATLFGYYLQSAGTKVWDRKGEEGIFDIFTLESGVYAQIFPKTFEAVGYDESQLGFIYDLIAYLGTAGEFILPILIVVGLFTQLAALGMVIFVIVQTYVDITGHGAEAGSLFDRSYEMIDERAIWIVLLLAIIAKGAGALSLDRVFKIGNH